MFLFVFDRLGRLLSVFHSGLCQGDRKMYSRTFLLVFYLGWLAAPLTHLLLDFVVFLFLGGRQSWPGRLVSLARWLGLLPGVCFSVFRAIVSQ